MGQRRCARSRCCAIAVCGAASGSAGAGLAQPSGYAALDAALPGGGWPEAALVEVLLAADGLGELSLLLPTLAR